MTMSFYFWKLYVVLGQSWWFHFSGLDFVTCSCLEHMSKDFEVEILCDLYDKGYECEAYNRNNQRDAKY
jgi:hypothetical protein